jgi:hypothetical protein
MRLYHYTAPGKLWTIARDGFLDVTESNIGCPKRIAAEGDPVGEHAAPDVLWLSPKVGRETTRDTLREGLRLGLPPEARHLAGRVEFDKTFVQFAVEVPDDEVMTWDEFATDHEISKRWKRTLEKGYARPEWWRIIARPVPIEEWVEIRPTWGGSFDFGAGVGEDEQWPEGFLALVTGDDASNES